MVFTENLSDDGERFRGKMQWKNISNFAAQKMQSFVSVVTSSNYDSFITRDTSKGIVLLFTERKTTAPIFKSLSK